jgi:cell division protein FtsQ|tara:strand:+ start:33925 stop:34662 length:738 start_codon:yes stop_codon:yes gene_type:complete
MIKILKNSIYVILSLSSFFLVVLLFKNDKTKFIKEVVINSEKKFLNKTQIEKLILQELEVDSMIKNINTIEKNILLNPYVKKLKLYQDLNNRLLVDIVQFNPIARIVSEKDKDLYVDLDGNIFPTSIKFSERVILIHIDDNLNFNFRNINSTDFGQKIFSLIIYIRNNDFLKRIISEIDIKEDKNIIIYPQVSKQKIIFGYPVKIDDKFNKLIFFYKKILPAKGWNTYRSVNLKFENQIVCNKNA